MNFNLVSISSPKLVSIGEGISAPSEKHTSVLTFQNADGVQKQISVQVLANASEAEGENELPILGSLKDTSGKIAILVNKKAFKEALIGAKIAQTDAESEVMLKGLTFKKAEVVSCTEPQRSSMPSLFRKLSKKHDDLRTKVTVVMRNVLPNGQVQEDIRNLNVRIVSSGRDPNSSQMREEFYDASVRVVAPIVPTDASEETKSNFSTGVFHLGRSSLQKRLSKAKRSAHFQDVAEVIRGLEQELDGIPGRLITTPQSEVAEEADKLRNESIQAYRSHRILSIPSNRDILVEAKRHVIIRSLLREQGINFESSQVLGKGGFGEVEKAQWHRAEGPPKSVAVKILSRPEVIEFNEEVAGPPEKLRGEGLGICLRREKLESTFSIPRLILVQAGDFKDPLKSKFFVISNRGDFFNLPSNSKIIATVADFGGVALKSGQRPFNEVLDIAHQMALGLKLLHQSGVVHYDFKLENVVIDENRHVSAIDPGLAHYLPPTVSSKGTRGTQQYMAPEVFKGIESDRKADSWSLGISVIKLLVPKQYSGRFQQKIAQAKAQYLNTGTRIGGLINLIARINRTIDADERRLNNTSSSTERARLKNKVQTSIKLLKKRERELEDLLIKREADLNKSLSDLCKSTFSDPQFLDQIKASPKDKVQIIKILQGLLTVDPFNRLSVAGAYESFYKLHNDPRQDFAGNGEIESK